MPEDWDVPWAEPIGSDLVEAGLPERADLTAEFAASMRRTGALIQLMSQAAADRIGINVTDLNCLNLLSFSGQMTAGQLAKATGLSTASITGVIDRLEEAGFVFRERDAQDRRRVVVRLVTERVVRDVASVFLPVLRAWLRLAEQFSDDELQLIVNFYGQMERLLREQITSLRAGRPSGEARTDE